MKTIMGTMLASAVLVAAPASAQVLVNGLPTGTLFGGNWTNDSVGQNFLVRFSLASASNVTGFQILEGTGFATLGDALRVKIRNDVGGNPALTNAFSFVDQIDAVSTYQTDVLKVTTNFAPITLAAGTYWFGVSGEGNTQVWATYDNGGANNPPYQRQLSGDTIQFAPGIYDLAFNVLGTSANAVPEPATWAMMLIGFGAAGAAMRRRGKVRTTVAYA